jgi:CubicO group peptidase (beta-lactamase class C family)
MINVTVVTRHLGTALLALALARGASAQTAIPDDVRASLRARIAARYLVGVVVGVVDSAGARYAAEGTTAINGGQPVNEHSMYEIGSVTKVFTALALADMVRRGEVALDDPVRHLLPEGSTVPSRNGREITLRLLSAQRSGLPRMPGNLAPRDTQNPYADFDGAHLLDFVRGYTLPRDPGERYEYSNLGVGLLGFALAQRGHESYEAMIARRVLTPLRMNSTMVTLTPEARARLAHGHDGERPAANWDMDALAGAGALRSDPEDMTVFVAAAMLARSTPLDSAFALTGQVQFEAGSPAMDIGLGWHILKRPTMRIIWHNGGTGGYRSFIGFDPARKIGVVVLSNSTHSVDDIGFHTLDPSIPLTVALVAISMAADSFDAYVGRYPLAPAVTLAVIRDGDALFLQLTAQPRFRMWPSAPDEFFLRDVDAQISFVRDSTGRVASLVLHQNGRNVPAPRTP